MPVTVACPNPTCGRTSPMPDELLGRSVRCKHCGTRFSASVTVGSDSSMPTERVAAPPAPPPKTVGRFEIRSRLGAGAFGVVFRALDPRLDREVALKVPRPGVLDDPKRAERFFREAKAAARLRHTNIVPVYEAGCEGGLHYIATAFIAGRPL